MADALKNAMKANAKQTEELAKKIYACMAIELYKDGWRDKRLENMCKSIRGVYDDLKQEDKSAVEILAEETGVELMSENSNKHWYEVPYLNGKVWDDYLEKHMNKVNKALKDGNYKSKIVCQIHDELILKVHKDEKDKVYNLVKDIMEHAIDLDVPLIVDGGFGNSWYESK